MDDTVVQGPYNSTSSNMGTFWSSIFKGYDEVVIELNVHLGIGLGDIELTLTSVNSGFRGYMSKLQGCPGKADGHGGSHSLLGASNIGVNCPQGDGLRDNVRHRNKATLL